MQSNAIKYTGYYNSGKIVNQMNHTGRIRIRIKRKRRRAVASDERKN